MVTLVTIAVDAVFATAVVVLLVGLVGGTWDLVCTRQGRRRDEKTRK